METVPSRYAEALLSLAIEEKQVKQYLEQAKLIYKALINNPEFVELLDSAFLNGPQKDKIIDESFKDIDIEYLKTFIKVICANNRAYKIVYIFREFIKLANANIGVKAGVLYSAKELSKQEISDVEKAFEQKTNYKIELENVIDPKIVGGIKVVLDDKVYDGSIQGRMLSLKQRLQGGIN